jgi:hypothetical protein
MAEGAANDEPVQAKANGKSAENKTVDGKTVDGKNVEGKRTATLEADRLAEKAERSAITSRESATQSSAAAKLDGEPLAGIRNKVPQAIVEAPGATWYVRPPSGGQFGPAPAEIFHEWLVENRVTRDSLVWRDGWPQWLVASDVFTDFFGPSLATTTAIAPTAPSIANTAAIESTTDRARLTRKMKRRRRYIIGIALLATLAIILVVTLIVVLTRG